MIHFLSGKIPLFPVCTVVILSSLIALPHTVPVLSLLESTFVCVASSSRSGMAWYWDTPPCACWSTSLRTYMLLARTWACWRNSTAFFLVSWPVSPLNSSDTATLPRGTATLFAIASASWA